MTCPEAARRATMSDAEFWEDVLGVRTEDDEPIDPPVLPLTTGSCEECGATDACAYDAEGRPLIHVTGEQE